MLRCAAFLPGLRRGRLIAARVKVRLTPRDLRALPATFLQGSLRIGSFITFLTIIPDLTITGEAANEI